ncbi:MAG: tail fiber protein [Rhodospirillaceae bacterium]
MDETMFAIRLLPLKSAPANWQLCDGSALRARLDAKLCEQFLGQKNTGPGCFTVPNLKSPLPDLNYYICTSGIVRLDAGNSYISAVKLFPQPAIPEEFIPCDGRILPVKGYEALYTLLGVTFGGSAGKQFALPKLEAPQAGLAYAICNMSRGTYPNEENRPSENELLGTISLLPSVVAGRLPPTFKPCNGGLLRIEYLQGLFSIINTTFGGDGSATMGLPKLADPLDGLSYVMNCEGIYPARE